MTSDILTLIQNGMVHFSKGQKLIANYIMNSYDKAAFMTASKLGKTVHVSESTVVRFAVELGYDGYPSMQKALQEMILVVFFPVCLGETADLCQRIFKLFRRVCADFERHAGYSF